MRKAPDIPMGMSRKDNITWQLPFPKGSDVNKVPPSKEALFDERAQNENEVESGKRGKNIS